MSIDEESGGYSWVKPFISGVIAIGAAAGAIGSFVSVRSERAEPLEPATVQLNHVVEDVRRQFESRVSSLENFRSQHEQSSLIRAEETQRQINALNSELNRLRDIVETNRARLDRIIDRRGPQ